MNLAHWRLIPLALPFLLHLRPLVRVVRVDTQKLPALIQPAARALTIEATVLVAPIIVYPMVLVMHLVLRGRYLNKLMLIGDW